MGLKRFYSPLPVASPSTGGSSAAAAPATPPTRTDSPTPATTVAPDEELPAPTAPAQAHNGGPVPTAPTEPPVLAQTQEQVRGIKEFSEDHIVSDPALRIPIDDFDPEIRDEVRRAYVLKGSTQPTGFSFPTHGNNSRSFCEAWYKKYEWLDVNNQIW